MKDLLIVVCPRSGTHTELMGRMADEARRIDPSVHQVLPNALLVKGANALDVAMKLREMTSGNQLPIAIIEIEGVLSVQEYPSAIDD